MKWIKKILNEVLYQSEQKKKQKQFGLLIFIILVIYLGFSLYRNAWALNTTHSYLISIILSSILITLLKPKLYKYLLYSWLFLGMLFGEVSSFLILF